MNKYYEVHEKDEASFDLPSTHRLPTVSAAEALEDLDDARLRFVATGLEALDQALTLTSPQNGQAATPTGGFARGQITEVWGPPASGKTALGIQLVANALSEGHGAAWTVLMRFADYGLQESLKLCVTPGIVRIPRLSVTPRATTLPVNTSVIIIDGLSSLVNHAFPKSSEDRARRPFGKGPGLSTKRLQTLQYLVSALQKLAATRDCAIVILSQCATKLQPQGGAMLVPSINASLWEQGIQTRLVLFKDWAWKGDQGQDKVKASTVCFAGVQKLEGRSGPEATLSAAAFRIEPSGLIGMQYDASQASMALSATAPRRKRKLGDACLEVPDSDEDDEDYGWEEEYDAAAPVPPQTQGSEDLIIGVHRPDEDEEGLGDEGGEDTNYGETQMEKNR